jgi:opacity protein-like surface antigen
MSRVNTCQRLVVIGLVIVTASVARSAVAAAGSSPPDSTQAPAGEWQFRFTPYLWLIGIEGSVSIGRREEEFAASFSDLFAALELGLMGMFEARRGRWGLIADGMYFDLGPSAPNTGPAGGTITAGIVEQLYSAGGLLRVLDRSGATVDLIAGARYANIDIELVARGGADDGQSRSSRQEWVDAIVGGRGTYPFARRWSAAGYLEAGAGGSDFTWQAQAGADFQLTRSLSARGGYRYLSINSGSGSVDIDLGMGGFVLGLGIAF